MIRSWMSDSEHLDRDAVIAVLKAKVQYCCDNGTAIVSHSALLAGYHSIANSTYLSELTCFGFTDRKRLFELLQSRDQPLFADCRMGAHLYSYLTGTKDITTIYLPYTLTQVGILDTLEDDNRLGIITHTAKIEEEYQAGMFDLTSQWICRLTDDDDRYIGLTSDGFLVQSLDDWGHRYCSALKRITPDDDITQMDQMDQMHQALSGIIYCELRIQRAGIVYCQRSEIVKTLIPHIYEDEPKLPSEPESEITRERKVPAPHGLPRPIEQRTVVMQTHKPELTDRNAVYILQGIPYNSDDIPVGPSEVCFDDKGQVSRCLWRLRDGTVWRMYLDGDNWKCAWSRYESVPDTSEKWEISLVEPDDRLCY